MLTICLSVVDLRTPTDSTGWLVPELVCFLSNDWSVGSKGVGSSMDPSGFFGSMHGERVVSAWLGIGLFRS